MNGKCLRCGSVHRNEAQRDRPGRLKNTKPGKGKSTPARPTSKPTARGRTAVHKLRARLTSVRTKRRAKGKGKSEKNQHKAKAKTGEVGFADEDQEEVDDNADVNEEDAEA